LILPPVVCWSGPRCSYPVIVTSPPGQSCGRVRRSLADV
jgi:hypothetical protein